MHSCNDFVGQPDVIYDIRRRCHCSSAKFMTIRLDDGTGLRVLNIVGEFTRECRTLGAGGPLDCRGWRSGYRPVVSYRAATRFVKLAGRLPTSLT